MRANSGFTLVEILIVVVILGILAAIVIPQFSEASTEAKVNSLCSDLQTLRSQIELYKVQHNDNPPALTSFEDQMIYCTDITGATATTPSKQRDPDNNINFGPYLDKIPDNPFTNDPNVAEWGSGATSDGWEYNEDTGEIRSAPDTTTESDAHQAL